MPAKIEKAAKGHTRIRRSLSAASVLPIKISQVFLCGSLGYEIKIFYSVISSIFNSLS